MAKRKFLNVRTTLEWVIDTCDSMIERDGKYENGLRLAPIDKDNLAQMRVICRAILRKRDESGTRKDLYVGTQPHA